MTRLNCLMDKTLTTTVTSTVTSLQLQQQRDVDAN